MLTTQKRSIRSRILLAGQKITHPFFAHVSPSVECDHYPKRSNTASFTARQVAAGLVSWNKEIEVAIFTIKVATPLFSGFVPRSESSCGKFLNTHTVDSVSFSVVLGTGAHSSLENHPRTRKNPDVPHRRETTWPGCQVDGHLYLILAMKNMFGSGPNPSASMRYGCDYSNPSLGWPSSCCTKFRLLGAQKLHFP